MFYNTGNKLKNSRFHTPHINQFMTEVKHSLNDHKHIRGLLKGAKLAPLSQGSYNSNDCGIKSQIPTREFSCYQCERHQPNIFSK